MSTLLVVDDDGDLLAAVAGVLEDEGFQVTTAMNGADALARLEVERPDLVLMDVMMPDMSGLEVLAEMRRRPAFASLPVVLMSAVQLREEPAAPARAFLKKPFSLDKLLAVLRSALPH